MAWSWQPGRYSVVTLVEAWCVGRIARRCASASSFLVSRLLHTTSGGYMPVEFTCLVTMNLVFKQTITKQTKVYFFRPLIFLFVVFVSFCLLVGVSCPSAALSGSEVPATHTKRRE